MKRLTQAHLLRTDRPRTEEKNSLKVHVTCLVDVDMSDAQDSRADAQHVRRQLYSS